MEWTSKLSLRHKLTLAIMINTVVALCAAGIGFAEYGVYRFKELRLEDLNALANILGTNSTAPLVFKDPNSAQNILRALAVKPHILSAAIYDRDGKPFAVYHRDQSTGLDSAPRVENDSSRFTSNRVLIFQTINFRNEKVGTVFLEGDTVEYKQLLYGYLLFFALVLAAVSLGAFAMAARLQRPISNPILELARIAKMVTTSRDYSIRAGKRSEDEVGVLIDGFNEMLGQIQNRDTELRHAREDLERRVDERTTELEQEMGDRQRIQEALHESEERIRLLLDSTAEAIFGIDRIGNLTFCNPAMLRLLGHENGDALLGKHAHVILHHSHPDGTPYLLEECAIANSLSKGEGIHSEEEFFWRADGTGFPVEFWAYPIRKEGEIVGAVITFLDITRRKRAQADLLEAKEAAESGSRAKSEFLANMSHEIRTPMNGIIGMTDLALDTILSAEQRDYLNLVKSSAGSLLHLINDILDFSKIEAGKLELEKTEFAIRDLFEDSLKTLALRTDNKLLEILVRVSPRVPTALVGDPMRLRQLIVNLVGNAIKFTEAGSIIVDTELEAIEGEDVRLHVSVTDTGIGIPLEKQEIIFESFAQADGSTTRRFGGTGLGLTISRQLVELMGGRIWVKSEIGKGSAFHFTCHFQKGNAPASDQEQRAGQTLPGLNVLIVDNNVTRREILEEMLTNWHMNPAWADSGANALEILQTTQDVGRAFPIVLLDASMPKIDGFQVMQRIQSNPGLAGAVIMMLSANRHVVDTALCRELGVTRCLTKPIGQAELLDAILLSLEPAAIQEFLIEPSHLPGRVKPGEKSLNILLSEDNPVNQMLSIRLLEKAGHRVTLASTGRKAVFAWEHAAAPGFDIVLMDIQMPEMDGMEAAAAIRGLEKKSGKHIPIVAMTAHAMRGDRERCLARGMDGYISKPIDPDCLFAEIERCCAAATERNGARAQIHQDSPEPMDRISLLERVEGDQELLTEIIHIFQENAPAMLAAMREALLSGDMAALERSAHSFKGAASNLSAKAAAAAALQLETHAKNKNAESARESLIEVERAAQHLLQALAELCQEVAK
jgi:two-component system, sensor histidine kinase and response regulator